PKQGTAAAQKLCDAKVNGVVGHLNSGTTIPASKIYNDCGIPHVTPSATNPKLTQQGFKTTFRLLANDNALGAGLALHAANNLKLKKVAVIDDRTAYGQGVAEVFKKTAQAKGMQIVDEQFTTDKATDFMAILTSIKSKGPEAVFYGGMDPQAGPMLRQMEQLGLSNVKFFGGDGICTAKLAELSGGAKTLGNVVCAEGGASLDKMPGGKAWKARYDAKYPNQFQVYSPYCYDAVMVLVDAMVRAKSADPKVYMPELFKTSYQGVTAKIQFEPDGELKNPAITLYEYKEGKKVPLN
ncbi:MAG TPA: branched-chain amino acid ABC transporter substrate-binding protein, partial [Burkholderiaceae bacterium]|nr:branched-chain amino acid ABC transporter substrate-binding protein [Burkholderiaceae bacterium]